MFTGGEQEFYAQKGFANEPTRCPDCRATNKARRNAGGGGSYGGGEGGYRRSERQMYPATCSACGKETQVPFEPRLDKPVYCSDCFTPRQSSGGSSYGGERRGNGGERRRW